MLARTTTAACLLCALGMAAVPAGAHATAPSTLPSAATTDAGPGPAPAFRVPARLLAHVPGASGSHVAALQQALIARGFAVPAGPTGYFGGQTQAAVAAFQRSQGWSGSGADGIPGPKTLALLGLTATSIPVQAPAPPVQPSGTYGPGSSGSHITTLQQALIARGFAIPAGPTGYFGGQTQAAVAAFQRSQGWSGSGADGIPGPKTLALLAGSGQAGNGQVGSGPVGSLGSAQTQFLAQYGPAARSATAGTGVPPLVSLAQAALESGWGSRAAGNNFFGVKAKPGDPEHRKHLRETTEILPIPDSTEFPEVLSVTPRPTGGYTYVVREWFRRYDSPEESFREHAELLTMPRYRPALQHSGDPYRFAAAIAAAGYATDPQYTDKLHRVMRLIEGQGWG